MTTTTSKTHGKGKRRQRLQNMRLLDSITDSMDMNLSKIWEIMKDKGAQWATIYGITKSQIPLNEWTTTKLN